MSAVTPAMHEEAREFLQRVVRNGSKELEVLLGRSAPTAPWHDPRALVLRANVVRATLGQLRACPHLPPEQIEYIDFLLTGQRPFVGFASSKEALIVRTYRENAAFAQWLDNGLERFFLVLQEQGGAA